MPTTLEQDLTVDTSSAVNAAVLPETPEIQPKIGRQSPVESTYVRYRNNVQAVLQLRGEEACRQAEGLAHLIATEEKLTQQQHDELLRLLDHLVGNS